VTVVHPPAQHQHTGATARPDPRRWTDGRRHGLNALHSTSSGNH
jgi:hypothetical protein